MKRFIVSEIDESGQTSLVNTKYMVIDMSKPYAPHVFEFVRDMEKAKGTWDHPDKFEDYVRQL